MLVRSETMINQIACCNASTQCIIYDNNIVKIVDNVIKILLFDTILLAVMAKDGDEPYKHTVKHSEYLMSIVKSY